MSEYVFSYLGLGCIKAHISCPIKVRLLIRADDLLLSVLFSLAENKIGLLVELGRVELRARQAYLETLD